MTYTKKMKKVSDKSISESSNTESNSDKDSEKKVKKVVTKKKILKEKKKSDTKKVYKKKTLKQIKDNADEKNNDNNDNNDDNNKNKDLYPIEKYLNEEKYDELIGNISKYDLTKNDLILLINKICSLGYYYDDRQKDEIILENIIKNNIHKYKIKSDEDITYLLSNIYNNYNLQNLRNSCFDIINNYVTDDKILNHDTYSSIIQIVTRHGYDLKKILKNFTFNNVNEFLEFFKKKHLFSYDKSLNFINFDKYGKDGEKEIFSYVYAMSVPSWKVTKSRLLRGNFYKYMMNNKIPITEKHLEYISNASNKQVLRTYAISSLNFAQKVNIDNKDNQFLKCKTIEDIDDFIYKNDYNITSKTIIIACQNNLDYKLIKHLLSFKLNYNENIMNEIIQSYRNNTHIIDLLIALSSQFNFSQNNYIEMVSSPYFNQIFSENIVKNLIIDKHFIKRAFDSIIGYNLNATLLESFLKNIESHCNDNKEYIDGILALYCGTIHISRKKTITKIKSLKTKFDVKLSQECLKYCCRNISNMKSELMAIFKEDEVKPDLEILKNFIKTINTTNEGNLLLDLI
jgi:hypothetical protein